MTKHSIKKSSLLEVKFYVVFSRGGAKISNSSALEEDKEHAISHAFKILQRCQPGRIL